MLFSQPRARLNTISHVTDDKPHWTQEDVLLENISSRKKSTPIFVKSHVHKQGQIHGAGELYLIIGRVRAGSDLGQPIRRLHMA